MLLPIHLLCVKVGQLYVRRRFVSGTSVLSLLPISRSPGLRPHQGKGEHDSSAVIRKCLASPAWSKPFTVLTCALCLAIALWTVGTACDVLEPVQ